VRDREVAVADHDVAEQVAQEPALPGPPACCARAQSWPSRVSTAELVPPPRRALVKYTPRRNGVSS
jgi:hypothetical protein